VLTIKMPFVMMGLPDIARALVVQEQFRHLVEASGIQ
jgi:hypothetical protein